MLTPNPIAFSIFGIEIRWYAICILTGIVLALLVGSRTLKKLGIDTDIIYDYLIVCLPLGIIGARLIMYYLNGLTIAITYLIFIKYGMGDLLYTADLSVLL